MKLLLDRYNYEPNQTIGKLYLLKNDNVIIDKWDSLELPDRDNQRNISCIPEGDYKASIHNSPKFGKTLWVRDVPNRSEILIHAGNFHFDILGCILIGTNLGDINNDGLIDVKNSRKAVNELLNYLTDHDSIMLQIK